MRIRNNNLVLLILVVIVVSIAPQVRADSAASKEYQIKAAFLYNFIKFVDWPKEKVSDANEPITIGIIGKDPFGKAFEPVKDKKVKNRKVVIKRFKGFEELNKSAENDRSKLQQQIQAIRRCYVLYICPSEKEKLKEIVSWVKAHPVLTVAEAKGFLDIGGIINFLMEENKVRFEINVTAGERAKLKIRSQLLQLAKRVVKEKDKPANGNEQNNAKPSEKAGKYTLQGSKFPRVRL